MKNLLDEFKKFAIKGNAIDLAIGVVIGAAFGKVVSSIVEDLLNPIIGVLTGGIDFSDKVIVLKKATEFTSATTLNYGLFITAVINFIIVAFAIFIIIKQLNKLKEKEEENPSAPPTKSAEEILLTEIRDVLKNK